MASTSREGPFLTDPTGRKHALAGEVVTIGRAVENDIVITSRRVSREHARVRREGWRAVLEDLNSTNGTFLNEERLLVATELHDGDRVTVGDVILLFHDPDTTYHESPFPELAIDLAAAVVRVDRRLIDLSAKEFALLAYLYQRRGQVCSKDDIGNAVWPEDQGIVYDYQVENLVSRLRSKLESEPADPQLLITMRGLGYKLVAHQ